MPGLPWLHVTLQKKVPSSVAYRFWNLHYNWTLASAWFSLLTNTHQPSWGIRICIGIKKSWIVASLFPCLFLWQVSVRFTVLVMTKQGDSHSVHRASRCQNTSWCNKGGLFSHVHPTFVFSSPSRLSGKTHKKHHNWMKLSAVGTCLSRACTKSLFAVSTHLNVSPL